MIEIASSSAKNVISSFHVASATIRNKIWSLYLPKFPQRSQKVPNRLESQKRKVNLLSLTLSIEGTLRRSNATAVPQCKHPSKRAESARSFLENISATSATCSTTKPPRRYSTVTNVAHARQEVAKISFTVMSAKSVFGRKQGTITGTSQKRDVHAVIRLWTSKARA